MKRARLYPSSDYKTLILLWRPEVSSEVLHMRLRMVHFVSQTAVKQYWAWTVFTIIKSFCNSIQTVDIVCWSPWYRVDQTTCAAAPSVIITISIYNATVRFPLVTNYLRSCSGELNNYRFKSFWFSICFSAHRTGNVMVMLF